MTDNKTLTIQDVQKAAEELMILKKETTTLDVKNKLRRDGFYATQTEVSRWMNNLCFPRQWTFKQNGNFRVFSFRGDTQEEVHEYMEHASAGEFWEMIIKDKQREIIKGNTGELGTTEKTEFDSNRAAVYFSKLLVEKQLAAGYVKENDQRLALGLRQMYGKYMRQRVSTFELGYFNVEQLTRQRAVFDCEGERKEGYLKMQLKAGYYFTWNFPNGENELKQILSQPSITLSQIHADKKELLGAKMKSYEAFDNNDLTITDFSEYATEGEESEWLELRLNNKNIYKVAFRFEGGDELELSKFDLDFEAELMPVLRAILKL